MYRLTFLLSLCAGMLAVIGGLGPQLTVRKDSTLGGLIDEGPMALPDISAAHWSVVAGALLIVVSLGGVTPRSRLALRPALSVLWVALIPPVWATLHSVITAVDIAVNPEIWTRLAAPTLDVAWGTWVLIAATFTAGAGGLSSALAGMYEREEFRERQETLTTQSQVTVSRNQNLAEPPNHEQQGTRKYLLWAAGLFSCAGLLLPARITGGAWSPWFVDIPFSAQACGQFLMAGAMFSTALVGLKSRNECLPALCGGAACALLSYASEYAFVACWEDSVSAGPGLWATVISAAAFVGAGVPLRRA